MAFEQAEIRIEREQEFAELKGAIQRAFGAANLLKFLKRVESKGVRIRDFNGVLEQSCIESVDPAFKRGGKTARAMYQNLPVSDQAQIREFYLSKLEEVDLATRQRFHKLYQYY